MAFFGKHLLGIAKLPQKSIQSIQRYGKGSSSWKSNGIESEHKHSHQQPRHLRTQDTHADQKKIQSAKLAELHDLSETLQTTSWREAVEKMESKPRFGCNVDTLHLYNLIALNAFDEGDFYLGWSTLNAIIGKRFNPHCDIMISYWRACAAIQTNFKDNIEKMFQFMSMHNVLVSRSAIDHLNTELIKFGGSATNNEVDSNSECSVCAEKLQSMDLTKAEFKELITEFESVLIHPQLDQNEQFRLKCLIGKKNRYDVVIDAMNVIRADKASTYQNKYKQAQILKLLIDRLLKENAKICIIGQRHLNEWPDHISQYIHRNATVHLTASKNDDLLAMYATLYSGREATLITNDLFKDHKTKLSTKCQELFERWQKQHQNYFTYDDESKSSKVHQPSILYRTAQSNGFWHIPYTFYPLMTNPFIYTGAVGWSCVKFG